MQARNATFKPALTISIYSDGNRFYAEESNIPEEGGYYYSKPLSEKTIERVFESLKSNSITRVKFGGYIPPYMIGYQEGIKYNKFIWRSEQGIEYMLFTRDAGLKSGKYAVPGLVWVFEDQLKMYAYKEWASEKTELYKAPFLNISSAAVCLGTASEYIKAGLKTTRKFTEIISVLERGFWDSKFSHIGTDKYQINGSFVDMLNKSKKQFPYEFLIPINKTIKQLIDEEFNS